MTFFSLTQTLVVLNPMKQCDVEVAGDCDLAGAFIFCLAFGGSLLLVSFVRFFIPLRLFCCCLVEVSRNTGG